MVSLQWVAQKHNNPFLLSCARTIVHRNTHHTRICYITCIQIYAHATPTQKLRARVLLVVHVRRMSPGALWWKWWQWHDIQRSNHRSVKKVHLSPIFAGGAVARRCMLLCCRVTKRQVYKCARPIIATWSLSTRAHYNNRARERACGMQATDIQRETATYAYILYLVCWVNIVLQVQFRKRSAYHIRGFGWEMNYVRWLSFVRTLVNIRGKKGRGLRWMQIKQQVAMWYHTSPCMYSIYHLFDWHFGAIYRFRSAIKYPRKGTKRRVIILLY